MGKRKTIATNSESSVKGYALVRASFRWENMLETDAFMQFTCRNLLENRAFDPGVRIAEGFYYPTRHPVEGRNFWLTLGYKV